jgi:hypothetical protein
MAKYPHPPRSRSTFRQADMTKAIRSAEAAGFEIGGVEVTRDGTIRVLAKGDDQKTDMPEHIINQL